MHGWNLHLTGGQRTDSLSPSLLQNKLAILLDELFQLAESLLIVSTGGPYIADFKSSERGHAVLLVYGKVCAYWAVCALIILHPVSSSGRKASIKRAEHPCVDFALGRGLCRHKPFHHILSEVAPSASRPSSLDQDDSDPFPLVANRSAFLGCTCIGSLATKSTSVILSVRMLIPGGSFGG